MYAIYKIMIATLCHTLVIGFFMTFEMLRVVATSCFDDSIFKNSAPIVNEITSYR